MRKEGGKNPPSSYPSFEGTQTNGPCWKLNDGTFEYELSSLFISAWQVFWHKMLILAYFYHTLLTLLALLALFLDQLTLLTLNRRPWTNFSGYASFPNETHFQATI